MRIVKYGSSGCGPCSRMSHYDEKVVRELGLDFEYVKKKTPDYNSPGNEEIKKQIGSIASPTYALVEGTTVLGHFIGGMDKGKFRSKVTELVDNSDGNLVYNHNLNEREGRENNIGGDSDSHCVDFDKEGCTPFRWDCQPDDATICRPDKTTEYTYRVTTHGCNGGCSDKGGGNDLHYKWEDENGKEVGEDAKEIKFEVGPDTPLGRIKYTGTAKCNNHPDNKEISKSFYLLITECDVPTPEAPEPLPPAVDPPPYDCDCPPETVQLWYDQDRGVYGSSYDRSMISSIQYMDAWDSEKKRIKLWMQPGGCKLDDVCECINLCSTTTAGGYTITELGDTTCETNDKERSVTVTFSGSWLEPNTGQGETVEQANTRKDCNKKGPDDDHDGSSDGQWIDIFTAWDCEFKRSECLQGGQYKSCKDSWRRGKLIREDDGGSGQGGDGGAETKHFYELAKKEGEEPEPDEDECKDDDDCKDDEECRNGKCVKKGDPDPDPDPTPEPSPEPPKDPCDDVQCADCETCVQGKCHSNCHEEEVCIDGACAPPFVEMSGNYFPNCLVIQCCADCSDVVPPFEEGDNDDCTNKPDPIPVPGTDGPAAAVYLYDRLNHTYVFCCPVQVDVTWLLPFDALPPIFQRYITAAATVRAAAQLVNNPQLFQLLKDRENTLRMECMNYELEQGDLNFLGQPDHTAYVGYQPIQTLNR